MKNIFVLIMLVLFSVSCDQTARNKDIAQYPDLSSLKTFGTMGKELQILKKEQETELFSYEGKGCLTHMWFGGDLNEHEDMSIRVYVDGEEQASIDMELFLGHGIGFKDRYAPWGTELMGNMGRTSGIQYLQDPFLQEGPDYSTIGTRCGCIRTGTHFLVDHSWHGESASGIQWDQIA